MLLESVAVCSPLHRIARLKPRASAVPEFMFSTTLCFTFFRTGQQQQQHHSIQLQQQLNSQLLLSHCISISNFIANFEIYKHSVSKTDQYD